MGNLIKKQMEGNGKHKAKVMTTSSGSPIDNNQNSMTAGPRGPILL